MLSALRLRHVYAAGAQSFKESFNILGFESVAGGQKFIEKFIELVEGDETGLIADLNGRTDDDLQVHAFVLSKLGLLLVDESVEHGSHSLTS
jgi:hypothetical protein